MVHIPYLALVTTALFTASASAYPMRNTGYSQKSTTATGTCASIGYTSGCCPPDEDCKATDGSDDCYCSSDCHKFGDCCSDIVNICPQSPSTCTELGFVDRCCVDDLNLGFCEITSSGDTCSCESSCYLDNSCCSDIGCSPSNCAEAGLDPGCCEGNCTVQLGDNEACYCDERCRSQGDCCEDVNQTKQCNRCTLTIVPGDVKQQINPRPRIQSLKLLERYQSRARKLNLAKMTETRFHPSTQRAYFDQHGRMRERLSTLLETKMNRAQAQRRKN